MAPPDQQRYPNTIDLDVSIIDSADLGVTNYSGPVVVLSEPRDGDVIRYMTRDEALGLAHALLAATEH